MLDPSLINEMVEIIAASFRTDEINELGRLILPRFDSNTVSSDELPNWGCLKDGRLYDITVLSADIVSEIINYAAHLEKKRAKAGTVAISRSVWEALPPATQPLFCFFDIFEDRDYFSVPRRLDQLPLTDAEAFQDQLFA